MANLASNHNMKQQTPTLDYYSRKLQLHSHQSNYLISQLQFTFYAPVNSAHLHIAISQLQTNVHTVAAAAAPIINPTLKLIYDVRIV